STPATTTTTAPLVQPAEAPQAVDEEKREISPRQQRRGREVRLYAATAAGLLVLGALTVVLWLPSGGGSERTTVPPASTARGSGPKEPSVPGPSAEAAPAAVPMEAPAPTAAALPEPMAKSTPSVTARPGITPPPATPTPTPTASPKPAPSAVRAA